MGLCAVIYSKDERVLRILGSLLADLSIDAEFTATADEAIALLARRKYDAIFTEPGDQEGTDLLRAIARSRHNKRSVAFVISSGTTIGSLASELGAHFVLTKPLATEKVKRTLKAAHGLMMREKRAHYRHEVAAPASIRTEKSGLTATLRNLSPGGAFFETNAPLKKGQSIQMRFMLPATEIVVETAARVVWCDPTGRVGVQFESMTDEPKLALMEWSVARSVESDSLQAAVEVSPENPAEEEDQGEVEIPAESAAIMEADRLESSEILAEPSRQNESQPHSALLEVAQQPEPQTAVKVLGFEAGRPVILQGICTELTATGLWAELQDELELEPLVLLQLTVPGRPQPTLLHAEFRERKGLIYSFEFMPMTSFL